MIHLDYQATTPVAPEAVAAMRPWLEEQFANPHSPSRAGRQAAATVAVSRDAVREALGPGAAQGAVYFTGGATESLNWAIKGALALAPPGRRRIVTVATEHAAVLETAAFVAGQGGEATVLPVGPDGLLAGNAAEAIDETVALVAVMLVNNEIGVDQSAGIAILSQAARAAGALMLCDAVQGFGRVPMPVADCDLIALSAHKVHGPKGVGALWVRDDVRLQPLLHGGGQEGGVRSGTLSPMLCAGFGAAAAAMHPAAERGHAIMLRDRLLDGLGPGWIVNGSLVDRWPGNLNVRRPGLDAGRLISEVRDVAFSAGSACASGSGRPSHVLRALGLTEAETRSSIRLGFGRYTTGDEIDWAAEAIRAGVARQGAWA